jgi:hypothetical protein
MEDRYLYCSSVASLNSEIHGSKLGQHRLAWNLEK